MNRKGGKSAPSMASVDKPHAGRAFGIDYDTACAVSDDDSMTGDYFSTRIIATRPARKNSRLGNQAASTGWIFPL